MYHRAAGKLLLLIVVFSFLFGGCATAPTKAEQETQRLTILYFNDLHGYLQEHVEHQSGQTMGGLPRLAALVKRIRQQNEEAGVPTLLLLAGDTITGSPVTAAFHGEAEVQALNKLQLDAAVVGNHEFDFGRERFDQLTEMAEFPWMSCNLRQANHNSPWLPIGNTWRFPNGPTVGVVGVSTSEVITSNHPDRVKNLVIDDPLDTLKPALNRTGSRDSLHVVLSHCGLETDKKLALAFDNIDIIVSGHDHYLLTEPLRVNNAIIVQAGKYGEHLGRLDLEKKGDKVTLVRHKIYPITPDLPEDPIVKSVVDGYLHRMEAQYRETIGEALAPLEGSREVVRRMESNLGDFACDIIRQKFGADIALLNGGGFRSSIAAGPITIGDIKQVFPFGDGLVVLILPGSAIQQALDNGLQKNPLDNPGSFLQVSGLSFEIDGRTAVNIRVGDAREPLSPDRMYQVVVSDYLASGAEGFAMLAAAKEKRQTEMTLDETLIEAVRQLKKIEVQADGRIKRLTPWR